jgi:pyridinium-3,5-biscarboxylic acid mononucleotide synthase
MDKESLLGLLREVAEGKLTAETAADRLRHLSVEDIGFAAIDHHRSLRKGFPEVIFGEGKSADQIADILDRMRTQERVVLATRVDPAKADAVKARHPDALYHPEARILCLETAPVPVVGRGTILVLSAGTSDIPVAMEAAVTARAMGSRVDTVFDVGVAGIHRLFRHREAMEAATVLVVVAGMEGALPSVVAGLVSRPVIAVPTSVGYGVSLGGLAALFGMLTSCSSNVAVVNIDNGFGAGYMAAIINRA